MVEASNAQPNPITTEEWRPAIDRAYQVSSRGRVRRLADHREIRHFPSHEGYLRVTMSGKKYAVARVVAAAFIGPCPLGFETNHKNANKTDNRPENLEYVTHLQNIRHKVALGRHSRGASHGAAKLSEMQVRVIHRLPLRRSQIAKMFGVHPNTVSLIKSGRTWRHLR